MSAAAHVRAMQKRDDYRHECERLRESLRWLLRITAEGSIAEPQKDGTPAHDCEFVSKPEKGACDFHFLWWQAVERAGLMDRFAAEPQGEAPAA